MRTSPDEDRADELVFQLNEMVRSRSPEIGAAMVDVVNKATSPKVKLDAIETALKMVRRGVIDNVLPGIDLGDATDLRTLMHRELVKLANGRIPWVRKRALHLLVLDETRKRRRACAC